MYVEFRVQIVARCGSGCHGRVGKPTRIGTTTESPRHHRAINREHTFAQTKCGGDSLQTKHTVRARRATISSYRGDADFATSGGGPSSLSEPELSVAESPHLGMIDDGRFLCGKFLGFMSLTKYTPGYRPDDAPWSPCLPPLPHGSGLAAWLMHLKHKASSSTLQHAPFDVQGSSRCNVNLIYYKDPRI